MQGINYLARYRPIVDDWEAFLQALSQPLPTCIWANTLRVSPAQLREFLAEDTPLEPLPWYPGGFQLPTNFKPGRHWAYLAGLFHVQEAVSMLPVQLLNPQPGQRVLDLCAAPANKTAQIALRLNNTGTIIANDINFRRMRGARQTLERLGLVNITTTISDGANFPKAAGPFDKVLVDVPCSAEGTVRKDRYVLMKAEQRKRYHNGGVQVAMLRKAILCCKPGGQVVYATCTFAPEENEGVVHKILAELGPNQVRLLPARIPGFQTTPGLTAWSNKTFHPSLAQSLRIWPHHNNTGGFYIALLEKVGPTDSSTPPPPTPSRQQYPPIEASKQGAVLTRFGIDPLHLKPYRTFQRNKDYGYLAAADHTPPFSPEPDSEGVAYINTGLRYPKLSTAGAMLLGRHATRNIIDLDADQTWAYLRRQPVTVSVQQRLNCPDMGYVLLRHRGFVLGVGLFYPQPDDSGAVESMYPKGWSPI